MQCIDYFIQGVAWASANCPSPCDGDLCVVHLSASPVLSCSEERSDSFSSGCMVDGLTTVLLDSPWSLSQI